MPYWRLACEARGHREQALPSGRVGSRRRPTERVVLKRRGPRCRRPVGGCNAVADQDALGVDMHRPFGPLGAAPPVADQDMLERLLEGRLEPGSAPPQDRRLASLLAAMTAPAAPGELAGERQAMASFAAARRSRPSTLSPRRTAVPRKVLTMKAAAAALVAALSLGGVAAAASGLLPDQAASVADQAPATGADAAAHGLGTAAAANRANRRGPGRLTGRTGRRRLGRMSPRQPGLGCAGPGRPARAGSRGVGWRRWRSRRWWRRPVGPMQWPATART
jgi:hypothetical protein